MIINEIKFPIYGTCIILSILIGSIYIYLNLKKEGIKKEYLLYFILLLFAFSIFGSFILTRLLTNTNGLTSYAGAISVIICAYIFDKIVPCNHAYLKYSIISLPLIYAVGKIGCFLVGCCYGLPYNGILSVTYTNGLNMPLFPVQITETVVFIILFLILNLLKKSNNIIELTIIICALSKFALDFLRYEHISTAISKNQIISIVFIVVAIISMIKKNLKN